MTSYNTNNVQKKKGKCGFCDYIGINIYNVSQIAVNGVLRDIITDDAKSQ